MNAPTKDAVIAEIHRRAREVPEDMRAGYLAGSLLALRGRLDA